MEEHKEDMKEVKIVVLEEQQEEQDDKTTELHRKKEKYARVDGHGKGVEDVQMEELREEGDCVEIDRHEYNGKDAEMAELQNTDEEPDSVSSGTFVDDFGSGEISSDNDDETNYEAPLTDAEIEELVAEFLEVESKVLESLEKESQAADAQEALEKESLSKVESDVRLELAETLHGDALEIAVSTEMDTFRENWEVVLDDLETQSALLLEQLDGAGIELPGLYKWIESQVPNGCCTEAWKKRAHWVGSQVTTELNQSVRDAEVYLQSCRPVRRKKGKMLEEGASGYLAKKLPIVNGSNLSEDYEEDWKSFFNLIQPHSSSEGTSFGSKNWESVYLASTPQQAANLGIKLPGVDEVEEIDETNGDPFYADAIANEKETDLSEEQKNNFRKVREEDDVNITRKLQQHLKRRRQRNGKHEPVGKEVLDGMMDSKESDIGENSVQISNSDILLSENIKTENPFVNGTCKRSHDEEDVESSNKKCRTVVIESDDEVNVVEKSTSNVSSRDKDSPSWDKKVIDIIDVDTLPSPCSQVLHTKDKAEEFHCTACYKVLKVYEVEKHPILEVIVCKSCKFLVAEKKRLGDHASGSYCAWCGKNIDLIRCSSCEMSFCAICLTRNFGLEHLPEAKAPGWQCCCCLPSLLHRSTLECERALGVLPVARHESDPDISDAEIDATISEQKRPKKRTIRRILDDAELGDETKQKIALEKARQEYLKSMQEQSDGKYLVTDIATVNGNSTVGVADGTGEIVNIAREEDEEQIRIPQSISSKLKPHQIAGIRFMWENVIQSVGKVKSGDKGLGCILAHTMGLGKTFQVIAFLYTALRGVNIGLRTALVVTPVNVLHNWRREFEKWRPSEYKRLRVLMLEDVARERRAELLAKWKSKGGVLLIGYATFRNLCLGKHVKDKNTANEICHALQYGPDVLVCDEAHMIKNTKADITQALKQVKTQRRIALTGSPLQNNLMEYFCMVDFVREGYLGSSHEFRNRFQNPIENGQHTNSTKEDVKIMNQRSHILYEQLKGFVQRMDMNVVKKDLPSKTVYVITVKLSPLQKKLYKKFLYAHGFANDKVSSDKRRSSFFMGYQALAQIWNHPGLLQMAKEHRYHQRREDAVENFLGDESSGDDNVEYTEVLNGEKQRTKTELMVKKSDSILCHEESDWWEDLLDEKIYNDADYSGKMVLLLDILAMSSGIGDKALVFSQSLTTLDLIEKLLSKLPREGRECKYWKQGKDWYRLDGSTDGLERQKLVERFNEPTNTRVKCTLISTRAGSLGINLHAANRVIVIDGSWNPTYDLQAIYRVWRYGQTKPVYAYRLMAHGTMEEKIYKRQVTKEGLAARVVDRQQIHRTMSKEEILHLFDFGDDENADMTDKVEEDPVSSEQQTTVGVGHLERSSFILSQGTSSSDKIMENLLSKHYPRWIANYHEHETLLQENEADRLSKEEQDMAWQTYQRSLVEWEEVQRTVIADDVRKPVVNVALPESNVPQQAKSSSRSHPVQRKCTNLAHLLTLRSQGTKSGGTTVCGECSQEISWESLNRDGKSR